MDVKSFVLRVRKVTTPAALFGTLEEAAGHAGLEYLAYTALKDHAGYTVAEYPAPAVMLAYPDSWVGHYFEHGYREIDPVLTHTAAIGVPYLWRWLETLRTLSEAERCILDEAREAGLRQGMTVPLIGFGGTRALVSFATAAAADRIEVHLGRLGVFAAIFHVAFVERFGAVRHRPPAEALTTMETRCLQWIAAGKTSWDIGVILGISEHTVRAYVRTVLRKLDVTNRAMAVARAMQLGLLDD